MSPKNFLVKCSQCQRLYIDWLVAAINIEPETLFKTTDTSAANVGPSTICSKCGHRAQVSDLCDRDGVLQQID